MRRDTWSSFACSLSLAVVAACGSQSGASSTTASGVHPGVDASGVTFTEVYSTVLKPQCGSCHAGLLAQFIGLDMGTQASAYKNLVGVHGTGSCAGQTLVVKGDAGTSLLYEKLTSPPCGSMMPQNAPALPQASIDMVKTWIEEGAPEN
jgi:hypothetical protein